MRLEKSYISTTSLTKKMKINLSLLLLLGFILFSSKSHACSPCGALSNVTQNISGTNLELSFTSNAGWDCCYTVQIEIICSNASFTGVPNYFSAEICLNGGNGFSVTNNLVTPYPLTIIDLTTFCPGTYKWRAAETSCMIYTPEQTFTVTGASPIVVDASLAEDTICISENTQFSASASNGCNSGTFNFSWAPAAGLNNPNISNPIATPLITTIYTLTVTEIGSCTAPQTVALTVNVNPLPTATISGTIDLCQNSPPSNVIFVGAGATAPYTIDYTLNGVAQTPIITSGTTTIQVPTVTPGTYTYALTNISESSVAQCSQAQNQTAIVTINPLPIVNAGLDQILCEPNDLTPSEVTLTGAGAMTYSWNNGVTNGVSFTPPVGTTIYILTGTDANGCTDTDDVMITSLTLPIANGTASDNYGNAPMIIDFTNTSQYATSYIWDFGDGNIQNVSTSANISNAYGTAGIYTIVLTASNGICTDTWTTQIEVLPPMTVIPPNVFSPNGDNINDFYFIDVQNGAEFEALILNRWGNEITTMTHLNQGWDGKSNGKVVEEGVYFIKYKATDFNEKIIEGHCYFHLLK